METEQLPATEVDSGNTLTVKKLFAGKKIKQGTHRLKLSADRNSKTLRFKVT